MSRPDLEQEIRHVLARQEELLVPPQVDVDQVIVRSRPKAEGADAPRRDRRLLAVAAAVVALAGGLVAVRLASSDGTPTVTDGPTTTQVAPPPSWEGPESSISQITDASRLLSDEVPDGFELALALDNADLGEPFITQRRAAYVDRSGEITLVVESITPTDPNHPLADPGPAPLYDNAVMVDVEGTEVTVHGVDVRRAGFNLDETSFIVDLPWWSSAPDLSPAADELLLAASAAIIGGPGSSGFPAEIDGNVLVGVEERGEYSGKPVVGAPDGSTTIYRRILSSEGPLIESTIEIQSRPIVDGRFIPRALFGPPDAVVYLDGVPVDLTPPGLLLTYDGSSGSPVFTDVSDPESQYLSFVLDGHVVSVAGEGVTQSELIAAAAALRTPNDGEWDVRTPR